MVTFVEDAVPKTATTATPKKTQKLADLQKSSLNLSLGVILKSNNSTLIDKLKLFLLKISFASQLHSDKKTSN